MGRTNLTENLIVLYKKLTDLIEKDFDLKVKKGLKPTKKNLQKVYTQMVVADIQSHSKAIICLFESWLESTTLLHSRKILEIYLQTRLIKKLNSQETYKNFFEFSDFSIQKHLEELLEDKDVIDKEFKEMINEILQEHKHNNTEPNYNNSLIKVKKDFHKEFPNDKQPTNDPIWWLGYSPKKLAGLFKDGAKEVFLKTYKISSESSHPTFAGYYDNVFKNRSHESPLVNGIHMSIWTLQLLTYDQNIQDKLASLLKELNELLENKKND